MKVLMIANGSERGGAPRSMMEMLYTLKNTYQVNFVVLLCNNGLLSDFCRNNNIDYVITGHMGIAMARGSTPIRRLGKFILRPYFSLRNYIINIKALKITKKYINMNEIDLIHTNSNRDGFGAILSKKFNKPHVWHIREFGKEDYDTVYLWPYGIRFVKNGATKFIAISKAVKNTWTKKGIPENKICHIYNGIDIESVIEDPQRKSFYIDGLKMIFVGTICPSKGQSEAIEAVGILKERGIDNINLDFIGDGAPEYERFLKKRTEELGINDRIKFLGNSDKVYSTLSRYNVGLTCSKAEAFGRITPEYMAAGLVVIASDTGANPELIDDGKSGFLYKWGNPENLAECIMKVLELSKENRIEIGKNGQNNARNKYTKEKNAENIFYLYNKIVEENF